MNELKLKFSQFEDLEDMDLCEKSKFVTWTPYAHGKYY
jgi:hypothetical protein